MTSSDAHIPNGQVLSQVTTQFDPSISFSSRPQNFTKKANHYASAGFVKWLKETGSSLAFSSYQFNQLFLLGLDAAGDLSFSYDTFPHCSGFYIDRKRLYLSTQTQIFSFRGQPIEGGCGQGYDHVYVSKASNTVGPMHIHDMVRDRKGHIIFTNTNANCLASLSRTSNFTPLWMPPFINKIQMGDCCHLNGLAMVDGDPRYVTVVSHQANTPQGWRDHRENGGCVIDITTNEIILTGLSMPHSPRWYQGKLWLHNSGTGEFGYVAHLGSTPSFQPIVTCPGFLRGLTFSDNYAIVGVSAPRNQLFTNLTWDQALPDHQPICCGLLVIDLISEEIIHWLYFNNPTSGPTSLNPRALNLSQVPLCEIYDVQIIPQVRNPLLLGPSHPQEMLPYITYDAFRRED